MFSFTGFAVAVAVALSALPAHVAAGSCGCTTFNAAGTRCVDAQDPDNLRLIEYCTNQQSKGSCLAVENYNWVAAGTCAWQSNKDATIMATFRDFNTEHQDFGTFFGKHCTHQGCCHAWTMAIGAAYSAGVCVLMQP